MTSDMRLACIIPTYNGREDLRRLLASLKRQTRAHDLIIVDSSSRDGTAELAEQAATTFISIASRDFNHGGTRQMVVDRLVGHDILVFLTQDAVLETDDALARLAANFVDPRVGAVCARQLPHHDANAFAAHARLFNYPVTSRIVDRQSIAHFGLKSAFMSNSFAAYRREALLAVGGFPTDVILCEDMFVAARMVVSGEWKIVYDSDAMCRHSHNYSIIEEFRRYFDLGVFHARAPWIRAQLGGAGGEGFDFVRSELGFLKQRDMTAIPAGLWRNAAKLVGYKLGQAEQRLPLAWKRRLSMHRAFWKSAA